MLQFLIQKKKKLEIVPNEDTTITTEGLGESAATKKLQHVTKDRPKRTGIRKPTKKLRESKPL